MSLGFQVDADGASKPYLSFKLEHSRIPFFFSSRRRHTRLQGDWSSDVCSSDLLLRGAVHSKASVQGKEGAPNSNGCILSGMRRGAPAFLTNVSPDRRNSINCAGADPRDPPDRKTGGRCATA